MRILISYYSRSGGTEKLANEIKEELESQGNTVEIEKVETAANYGWWTWFFLRMFIGTTKIKSLKIKNVSEYDLILIGSPNWTRLSLPMAKYLKTIKGAKYKSFALFSTTAFSPSFEWYLFSSYLLDFTFERTVEKNGGIPIGSLLLSSFIKGLSVSSRYGQENLKAFTKNLYFSPLSYKRKTFVSENKRTNRFLVILFSIITIISVIFQITASLINPHFLTWSLYGYFFIISFLILYILIITAQYEKLLFFGRYFAGFSLIILWTIIVLFFPFALSNLLHYGLIIIIIFIGFLGQPKVVLATGVMSLTDCAVMTIYLIPNYIQPSTSRMSAILIVTLVVALLTSNNKRKYVESVELERELKNTNILMRESDQAKSDFITIASHILRTPLTKADYFFDLVKVSRFRSPHEVDSYKNARESIFELKALSEALLTISSLEEGRIKIRKETLGFKAIVQEALDELVVMIENKVIHIENHLGSQEIFVECDRIQLKQAIYNLIENAIKFNRLNGFVVLDLVLDEQRNEIIFSVADNGKGIPKEKRKTLFNKFSRIDIYNYVREGIGLGLYLTKLIIIAHRGRIWFNSKENEGSTFYISLPVSEKVTDEEKSIDNEVSKESATTTEQPKITKS